MADGGGGVMVLTDANFITSLAGPGPLLVDCWAAWCGPCRMIAPVIEQLAAEAGGRYRVGKLNVDENPAVAGQFQIQSIPTLLIFKDAKLVDSIVGLAPKAAIAAKLAQWA
jgi:thioredoxin